MGGDSECRGCIVAVWLRDYKGFVLTLFVQNWYTVFIRCDYGYIGQNNVHKTLSKPPLEFPYLAVRKCGHGQYLG